MQMNTIVFCVAWIIYTWGVLNSNEQFQFVFKLNLTSFSIIVHRFIFKLNLWLVYLCASHKMYNLVECLKQKCIKFWPEITEYGSATILFQQLDPIQRDVHVHTNSCILISFPYRVTVMNKLHEFNAKNPWANEQKRCDTQTENRLI